MTKTTIHPRSSWTPSFLLWILLLPFLLHHPTTATATTTTSKISTNTTNQILTPISLPSTTFSNGIILLHPPPSTPPHAIVRLDIYEDLLCPDCRALQPILTKLLQTYNDTGLQVVLHLFPLPYHQYSYLVNRIGMGLALANQFENENENNNWKYTKEAVEAWRDTMFAHQDDYSNTATAHLTYTQVATNLTNLAVNSAGLPRSIVNASIWDRGVDLELRTACKTAWLRGVTGTPFLVLNGVPLYVGGGEDAFWTEEMLMHVLDPLLRRSKLKDAEDEEEEV